MSIDSNLLSPGMPLVMQVQRALALHQQGRLADAETIYKFVLRTAPNQADCLHYLGVIRHQAGHNKEAVELIKKSIKLNKSQPAAHTNLGLALYGLGKYQLALESYDQALGLDRNFIQALNNRGNVLRELGRHDEAVRDYDAAVAVNPRNAEAYKNRIKIFRLMGRNTDALRICEQLLVLEPGAELASDKGCLERDLLQFDAALKSFNQAIAMQPDFLTAWSNKGALHKLLGHHQAAYEAFDQCVKLAPDSVDFRIRRLVARIPVIRQSNDDVDAIRANFSAELADLTEWFADHEATDLHDLKSFGVEWPFYLAYHEKNNREILAPLGQICTRLMAQWREIEAIENAPARQIGAAKIRIGIVSAHVFDHPVWNAMVRGWVQELDCDRFELHIFYLDAQEDASTAFARTRATVFHSGTKQVQDWAKLIVASNADALIYPELGMDSLTPKLAAMRLARHQIVTWGHPETTGLPTMDAYLSADYFEDKTSQDHYSETLVRLPGLGCYYEPDAVKTIDVNLAEYGVNPEAPLFICPGSPFKYAPEHDHVFVDIAKRLPDSQFLFFTNPRVPAWSELFQKRLDNLFRASGLDPSVYLRVMPWQSSAGFYSVMRQATAFLDTIGFSGFNTAMQAIDCALPIVTMNGKFMRGRFAAAIQRRIGLDELVHGDADSYVESAVQLATDPSYRDRITTALVGNRSVLYRDTAPIRALENYLNELR